MWRRRSAAGLAGGVIAGIVSSLIVHNARRRNLVGEAWLQIIPVAAAGLAYGIATPLRGSGFIAAFVAGAMFGALAGEDAEVRLMSEELGDLLAGVTFLVFGAVLLGRCSPPDRQDALYAVLSLTIVRMLPVAIAMLGSHARPPTVSMLGWFGPRGLASIVFAVIVVEEAHLPGADTIVWTTYATIGLSVFAHGLTAVPLTARYVRWFDAHREPSLMECASTAVPRVRAAIGRPLEDQRTEQGRVRIQDPRHRRRTVDHEHE